MSRGQRTRLAEVGGGKEEEAQWGRGGRIPPREGRWMRSRRWSPEPAPLPARPPQGYSGLTQSPGSPSHSLLSLSQLAGLHSSLRPAARGPADASCAQESGQGRPDPGVVREGPSGLNPSGDQRGVEAPEVTQRLAELSAARAPRRRTPPQTPQRQVKDPGRPGFGPRLAPDSER